VLVFQGALHAPAISRGALRAFSKALDDAAYSLYLTQFLVLPPAAKILGMLLLPTQDRSGGAIAFVTGLVAVSIVVALLSYRWIERPVIGWAHRV
jgi:peptidoglycan/LPS O-acetylase OafA/YrhL